MRSSLLSFDKAIARRYFEKSARRIDVAKTAFSKISGPGPAYLLFSTVITLSTHSNDLGDDSLGTSIRTQLSINSYPASNAY